MCKDEKCLIVGFLLHFQPAEWEEFDEDTFEKEQNIGKEFTVPQWLRDASSEDLAKEMLRFRDIEFPKEKVSLYYLSSLFWSKKGIDNTFGLPPEIGIKIEQADKAVREQLQKEEVDKKRARLTSENEALPSLVSQCVEWAIGNGMKRISLPDVGTFVLQNNIDILKDTKKALYLKVNAQLRNR